MTPAPRRLAANLAALAVLLSGAAAGPPDAAEPPGELPKGAPPAVGERRSGQTAEEVALRDQAVLLKGGSVTLELGASYARAERDFGVGQLQQSVAVGELAVRVGLWDDVQISARMPWRYRHSVAVVAGGTGATTANDSHRGFGDLSLGLFGVVLHEGAGRPNLIFSLEGVAPTGPGDAGVGAGFALTRSYDPVILFVGVSWMYGLRIDTNDPDRALAQHNVGFRAGYAFAVNESVALGGQVIGAFRNYGATPSGFRPSPEQYRLQLGLTYLVTPRIFAEPTVTFGLGGAAPDVVFGLSLPASL